MSGKWAVPLVALLGAVLAACPGDDDTTSLGVRLSGRVTLAEGQVLDGDVADPAAPYAPNDTPEQAQAVAVGGTVGGWVGSGWDDVDLYRVTLAEGASVTLALAEPGGVELCLYAADAPATPLECALGLAEPITVVAPGAREYLVGVETVLATVSSSAYVLELRPPGVAASLEAPGYRLSAAFVPGEVLVTFRAPPRPDAADAPDAAHKASADRAEALAREAGLAVLSPGPGPSLLSAGTAAARAGALAKLGARPGAAGALAPVIDPELAARRETLQLVAALRARADVATADPNYVFQRTAEPDDPLYASQWHYGFIGLPQAWDVTTGTPGSGPDVIVAVLDSGVFHGHPDLAPQLVSGYDFISSATNARDGSGIDDDPEDPGDSATPGRSSWHGTHVSGTIAARSGNAAGGAGVSWGARIMPLRVLGAQGGTSADVVQALRFATRLANASGTVPPQAPSVANLSLGCAGCYSATEEAAYQAARDAGLVVVASSGNDRSASPSYPAAYASVLSVGAVDVHRQREPYSNFGPTLDLVAPGGDGSDRDRDGRPDAVLSTYVDDRSGTKVAGYAYLAGTSMAAPHVSGVLALMKAVCPSLGADQVDALLQAGALTLPTGAGPRNDETGYGVIDALAAVQAASGACGVTPPPGLRATPGQLHFAAGQVEKRLVVARSGGDPAAALAVAGVTSSVPWLSAEAEDVDGASALGTYVVRVDRAGLAVGVHSASLVFTTDAGRRVRVRVTASVGGVAAAGGGFVYVLLVDPAGEVRAVDAGPAGGAGFAFTFTRVVPGDWRLVAGTDVDNDARVRRLGEAFGAWPSTAQPQVVSVSSADRRDLDFTVGVLPADPPSTSSAASLRRSPGAE